MAGKARFMFWWDGLGDNGEPLPCFNVVENDKGISNGSTVDGTALLEQYGIPLPLFPSYETWRRETAAKRRCGKCWAVTRGRPDASHHLQNFHKQHIPGGFNG